VSSASKRWVETFAPVRTAMSSGLAAESLFVSAGELDRPAVRSECHCSSASDVGGAP